jgi:hypothetical protein
MRAVRELISVLESSSRSHSRPRRLVVSVHRGGASARRAGRSSRAHALRRVSTLRMDHMRCTADAHANASPRRLRAAVLVCGMPHELGRTRPPTPRRRRRSGSRTSRRRSKRSARSSASLSRCVGHDRPAARSRRANCTGEDQGPRETPSRAARGSWRRREEREGGRARPQDGRLRRKVTPSRPLTR